MNEFAQGPRRRFVDPFAPKLDYTEIRCSRIEIPGHLIWYGDNLGALEKAQKDGYLIEEWQNYLAIYKYFYPFRPLEHIELWWLVFNPPLRSLREGGPSILAMLTETNPRVFEPGQHPD